MRVAVLGLGNVGLNLLGIMNQFHLYHKEMAGEPIEVVAAGDFKHTLYSENAMDLDRIVYYKKKGDLWGAGYTEIDRNDIFEKQVDIVVDVTTASRTGEFGRDIYLSAFRNGMDVATASKSPLANHWKTIMEAAKKFGRHIRYESTVAGGVPLFSFLDYCVGASPAVEFRGIVNGTANFVLSKISSGLTMDEAIDMARDLGIAEADASLDIDGYDNAWKALIVANRLSAEPADISELSFQGIREYLAGTESIHPNARLVSEVEVVEGKARIYAGVKELESSDALSSLGPDALGYYIRTGTNEASVAGLHDGPLETAAGVMNDIILLAKRRRNTS